MAAPATDSSASLTEAPASTLPPLTAAERRIYDKLAVGMERFHGYFRSEFNEIYQFADKPERLAMSLPAFLQFASGLSHHLHMHHQIEERHFFPLWGQRIPAFNESNNGDHCLQHKQIHDGLDRYDAVLAEFRASPSSYSPARLREVMDSFRTVLFLHLDEEVKTLSADSIRNYYSLEEMKAMYL